MHISALKKLYASFGFILILLLVLVAFSWRNFRRLSHTNTLNVHSYQVLLKTDLLLRSLIDMETGLRGFLVANDDRFLEPFYSGQLQFNERKKDAQNTLLLQENQQRLKQIEILKKQWLIYAERAIAKRRRARDGDEAIRVAVTGALRRKQSMDNMRVLLAQIADVENILLTRRTSEQKNLLSQTWITFVLGGIFSVISTMFLASTAGNSARRLFQTVNQLENAKTRLETEARQRARAQIALDKLNGDLKRSNDELEHFAYVASHDLQEPLRAVAGCVQVLKRRYEGKLDERANQLIQHSVDGAARMQTLINDLLTFSRVGSKGGPLVPTDMNEVFRSVQAALGVAIAETDAQISHDELPVVSIDGGQIAQLLQNLVANAIKFRGEKPPEIHFGARRDDAKKEWIFSVADKGIGIESEYFERIFVMFQRLHTRNDYPGTGIGLAICKKIIERHGGRIGVESAPENGSTFWFSVPDINPENNQGN